MNANNCTVNIYSSGTTEIVDFPRFVEKISNLRFATGYPGGLYLDCTFYISRELADWWALAGAQRVVVRNGIGQVVYEGWMDSFDYIATDSAQGVQVNCVGAWARFAMNRRTLKFWGDTRTDEKTWKWYTTQPIEMYQVDRTNRIRISAAGGASYAASTGDDASVIYIAPAGVTLKRVSYDFAFSESTGRAFTQVIFEATGSESTGFSWNTLATSVLATGSTGSHDLTLGSNITSLRLALYSNSDNADVESDEHNYATWANLCVYSETGTIDLPAVVADTRALISEVNTTEYYINAMSSSRSLVGSTGTPSSFGAFDGESIADLLTRAASFGDGSNNRWAVGFRHSELAPVPDGKPVIYCEQYPALTDYDFSVRLDEKNLVSPLTIKQNFGMIYNYILVRYTDDNDNMSYISPEDDSGLKDTTSIATYGQRDYLLDVGNASAAMAKNNGYRFLAAYKNPQFELPSPVTVRDQIRTKSGLYGPVSQVRAGYRLRVENFVFDLTGVGTGATFLISATDYDDTTETVTITAGPPDGLIYPVYRRPAKFPIDEITETPVERYIPTVNEEPAGGGGDDEDSSGNYPMGKGNKQNKQDWEKNPQKYK